jgi:hypothetical protein
MHLAAVSAYEAGLAMPVTNAAKELYRLAMMEGHAIEDFSAVYKYLATNDDLATTSQKVIDLSRGNGFTKLTAMAR